ncbi:MAG: response regulator [candidate division Zixibacteria bacterium]|nr:response regulator [candidate division Zixibacteria bacterium]
MSKILLACRDDDLRGSCKGQLEDDGYLVHWVTSGEDALDYVQSHEVDLVILHADVADRDCSAILEVLRSFRPDVSVVLTSNHFDYWNNFMTWLADACLVPSPDLAELKETVGMLLEARREEGSVTTTQFAVDWQ